MIRKDVKEGSQGRISRKGGKGGRNKDGGKKEGAGKGKGEGRGRVKEGR